MNDVRIFGAKSGARLHLDSGELVDKRFRELLLSSQLLDSRMQILNIN